ncbi:MAG: ATP-dependent helicase [Phycisphaerae bacterium]
MDLLADLNEPQRRAVTHVDGPLLVLAGAGSGKTRVITRRVAWLIHSGVAPWHVLAITFTNRAAEEMAQRVRDLNTPSGATVCTFHSLCARLLREFAAEAGLSGNFSIYDRADQLRLLKQALERLQMPSGTFTPAKAHGVISKVKNQLKSPEALAEEAGNPYDRRLAQIYGEYERLLVGNNALDFDDLLLRMAMLLRDRPEIRRALGERYRYVLIDEYQDTNHAQYLIAHGIALDHENICVTGDPDQSIYAWRGADVGNIMEFESDYPNAVVVRLEENYRSTAPILSAASRLVSHNRMRKAKSLWTRRAGGATVKVLACDDGASESQLIADRIAAHRDAGGKLDDVAVFYRVNALSRQVEETLLKRGIAYRIARGTEFYNRKEVKDVLAYLKLLVNPADDLSCLRIINTPARGIGGTTIERLRSFAEAHGCPVLEACARADAEALGAAGAKRTTAFARIISSLSDRLDRPVREIIEDVVRESGLEDDLSKDDEDTRQALSNVHELISTAAEFDRRVGGSLADYLYQVSLVSDVDHFQGGDGAVTLMTLHAAKGLEFPKVFVIGCEDGLLPFKREHAPGEDSDMEEERRLLFVGMTRAMDELTLTHVRRRVRRGRGQSQRQSPFLKELDGDGVESQDHTSGVPASVASRRRFGGGGFYAPADERATIEAIYEQQERQLPPEYEYLRAGCRVRHPRFGEGQVLQIGQQPWPQTRAEIAFDEYGPKTIVLGRTSLELITEFD